MRFRLRQTDSGWEESMINLTPLIDVLFVVLIAFILIAPMLEVDHIALAYQDRKSPYSPQLHGQNSTTIQIRKDNSIWLNKYPITLKELKANLIKIKATKPLSTPKLLADKEASFGTYQEVKNAVESSGFEQMDLILQPR